MNDRNWKYGYEGTCNLHIHSQVGRPTYLHSTLIIKIDPVSSPYHLPEWGLSAKNTNGICATRIATHTCVFDKEVR